MRRRRRDEDEDEEKGEGPSFRVRNEGSIPTPAVRRRARDTDDDEPSGPSFRMRTDGSVPTPAVRRPRENDVDEPPERQRRRIGGDDEDHTLLTLFEATLAHRTDLETRKRRSLTLVRRSQAATRPPESRDTDVGDQRVAAIRRRLDSFGMRSADQKAFHEMFIEAALPHIYGKSVWPMVAQRVLRRMRLERIRSEVLILTPRRWGKTTSVAMFVAAMALEVPGVTQAVYSTGKRASGGVMAQVGKYLSLSPDSAKRVVSRNQEQLFVSEHPPDGTKSRQVLLDDAGTSKFWSYPSSGDRE